MVVPFSGDVTDVYLTVIMKGHLPRFGRWLERSHGEFLEWIRSMASLVNLVIINVCREKSIRHRVISTWSHRGLEWYIEDLNDTCFYDDMVPYLAPFLSCCNFKCTVLSLVFATTSLKIIIIMSLPFRPWNHGETVFWLQDSKYFLICNISIKN